MRVRRKKNINEHKSISTLVRHANPIVSDPMYTQLFSSVTVKKYKLTIDTVKNIIDNWLLWIANIPLKKCL
jgi:hypothetical protein